MENNRVLILSPFFRPNIGGVETHLDDLIEALRKNETRACVESLSPITTEGADWVPYEKIGSVEIYRTKWYGQGFFPRIEKYFILSFLYLTPAMIYLLIKRVLKNPEIKTIHAHGINAALAGVLLKIFVDIRLVVSIHAVYEFNGYILKKLIRIILNSADKILSLSDASLRELRAIGVNNISRFKYWVDLEKFSPIKSPYKNELDQSFTVIYVGRLIEKKGIRIFLDVANELTNISFKIVGTGPLDYLVHDYSKKIKNLEFMGGLSSSQTAIQIKNSNILCVPSLYEEGFGRVAIEAVASGIPVVGAKRGGLIEAVDSSVSILGDINKDFLIEKLNYLNKNREIYNGYAKNCRKFAEENYSEINANIITCEYI